MRRGCCCTSYGCDRRDGSRAGCCSGTSNRDCGGCRGRRSCSSRDDNTDFEALSVAGPIAFPPQLRALFELHPLRTVASVVYFASDREKVIPCLNIVFCRVDNHRSQRLYPALLVWTINTLTVRHTTPTIHDMAKIGTRNNFPESQAGGGVTRNCGRRIFTWNRRKNI